MKRPLVIPIAIAALVVTEANVPPVAQALLIVISFILGFIAGHGEAGK